MHLDNKQDEMKTLLAQRDKEQGMVDKGIARSQKDRKRKDLDQNKAAFELIEQSIAGVMRGLQDQIDIAENRKGGPAPVWLDDLQRVELRTTADMALRVVFDAVSKTWTLNKTAKTLGYAFKNHLFAHVMSETRDGKRVIEQIQRQAQLHSDKQERRRDYVMRIAKKRGYDDNQWDDIRYARTGAILWNACLMGAQLFAKVSMRLDNDEHLTEYVAFKPEIEAQIADRNIILDAMKPVFEPMLQKPLPWSMDNIGPYIDPALAKMVPLVKNTQFAQDMDIDEAMRTGDMDQCIEAINFLQETPYAINSYVVDAVEWIYTAKLDRKVNGFPNLTLIKKPKRMTKEEFSELEKQEQIELMQESVEIDKSNADVRSNLQNVPRYLEEAKFLHEQDEFFLPHQLDRRGRVYHVPDFGHHNADYIRGMFKFANEKPIGNNIAFLALQIANTYGQDKIALDQRVQWVEDNEEIILLCGETFKHPDAWEFWRKASDPFQFLAAANELYKFRQFEAENPDKATEFMSGLPIALDATQSGIQHYAAASRNQSDGELVNLVPQDKPNDLYIACLNEAKRIISDRLVDMKTDAAYSPANDDDDEEEAARKKKRDNHIDIAERTLKWEGYNRNVMKRNAMTYSYSSRRYGFSEQLQSDIMSELSKQHRLGEIKEHPFGSDRGFRASHFLAGVHEQAIERVVSSAAEGMAFLQACAAALAREGKHFSFITKWGFPVHQQYVKFKPNRAKVWWFDEVSNKIDRKGRATLRNLTDEINITKSCNAVAPNVIHAQDSLHLMMSVQTCASHGVTDLMVVHDSFSTTIADASTMSWAIREAFVQLYYDYCLFSDIKEQVLAMLDQPELADLPDIPYKGSLDIEAVLQSDYAFS